VGKGGKVKRYFPNVDMRMGHDGLKEYAKKEANLDLDGLKPGEYVAFFNAAKTILKLGCANGVIATKKSEHGRFFDATCITQVVEAFNNTGKIDYDAVVAKKLEQLLERRSRTQT
jgi:hypothetical protein